MIIIIVIINKQAFHLYSIICVQMSECMSSDGPHRRATDKRTNKQARLCILTSEHRWSQTYLRNTYSWESHISPLRLWIQRILVWELLNSYRFRYHPCARLAVALSHYFNINTKCLSLVIFYRVLLHVRILRPIFPFHKVFFCPLVCTASGLSSVLLAHRLFAIRTFNLINTPSRPTVCHGCM